MDQLSALTEVATLNILVVLLRPLLQEEFSVALATHKAAGTLSQKRALLLYKVLGEVANLAAQLHTRHRLLLETGRTGQLPPDHLAAMAAIAPQCETPLRHLAATLRAIHPVWGLKPQTVVDRLSQWGNGAAGAPRFLEELRWEMARQAGRAVPWRQAFSTRLDQLLAELDANHRQIQDGLAAVRQWLRTAFVFSEEFFPH
ncbi:MAG TPA: hypothetical protein VNN62_17515 [Methylomirabilota bacterium]|nr:hypothetical protein [Methylomirabilota bacterium]